MKKRVNTAAHLLLLITVTVVFQTNQSYAKFPPLPRIGAAMAVAGIGIMSVISFADFLCNQVAILPKKELGSTYFQRHLIIKSAYKNMPPKFAACNTPEDMKKFYNNNHAKALNNLKIKLNIADDKWNSFLDTLEEQKNLADEYYKKELPNPHRDPGFDPEGVTKVERLLRQNNINPKSIHFKDTQEGLAFAESALPYRNQEATLLFNVSEKAITAVVIRHHEVTHMELHDNLEHCLINDIFSPTDEDTLELQTSYELRADVYSFLKPENKDDLKIVKNIHLNHALGLPDHCQNSWHALHPDGYHAGDCQTLMHYIKASDIMSKQSKQDWKKW
jgi:hypothetical protein